MPTSPSLAPSLLRSKSARFGAALIVLAACGYGWSRHLQAPAILNIPPPESVPSPNAYDDLVRIATRDIEPPDDDKRSTATTGTASRAGKAMNDVVTMVSDSARQTAFVTAEPSLNELRTALKTHAFRQPPHREAGDFDHTMADFRSLGRTLAFESAMREQANDFGGAASSALDAVQLGLTYPRGGGEIAQLVGIAIEAIGERRLFALTNKLSAPQALDAARRLQALDAASMPLADALTEQKWQDLQRLRDALSRGTTFDTYRDVRSKYGTEMASLSGGTDDGTAQMMRSQTLKDWWELLSESKQNIVNNDTHALDTSIAAARLPVNAPNAPEASFHDPIAKYLLGDGTDHGVLMEYATARMNRGLLITSLALRAWKLTHGDYPQRLQELTSAGLLTAVPGDPFAPTAGVPLSYRRQDADHFVLYSVGPDGKDDGGRPVETGILKGQAHYAPFPRDKGDWVYSVNGFPVPASHQP